MSKVLAVGRGESSGGAALAAVVESMAEGMMLFDADDRLVVCNAAARDFFAPIAKSIKPGAGFEDLAKKMARKAVVGVDGQSADEWLEARLARHRQPDGPFEDKLADGRWVRVSESPTGNGGVVALFTDVTVQKQRER